MSEKDKTEPEKIGKFRTILPQVLASTAKNFLLLDLGMAVSFPTIVIPALRGLKSHDVDFLSFTDSQASWFGKKKYKKIFLRKFLKMNFYFQNFPLG